MARDVTEVQETAAAPDSTGRSSKIALG